MAGNSAFVRQLGYQSGVQLNNVIDDTGDSGTATNTDQIFAVVGRFNRGRIDKAFSVNSGTYVSKLGPSAAIALSGLNECYVQLVNALNNGAYSAVVSRLVPSAAVNSYMVFSLTTGAIPVGSWATSPTVPTVAYGLLVQHLECFNDGVTIQINAVPTLVNGVAAATTSMVRLQLLDNQTGTVLNSYDFTGSLVPTSVDEFGVSNYLPTVVASQTGNVIVQVGASFTSVPSGAAYFGNDVNGNPVWNSANLSYFSEGGTTYATSDYTAATTRLQLSTKPFGYMISGGTQNPSLLSDLFSLAFTMNIQFLFDIPGALTPAAAITFYNQFNFTLKTGRYAQAYWAPLTALDPVNGGTAYYGASSDNVGYRCYRNSQTNSSGLAPKNYPVAGISFPLARTKIVQTYTPSDAELSALAQSCINPVIYVVYASGGKYVFYDSLTSAPTTGATMLINVTEMATSTDTAVSQYGQECLQLPMTIGLKRMNKFLKDWFAGTDAAGWTTPSADPLLKGASNYYNVYVDVNKPFTQMDVDYGVHYDGTVRTVLAQQTIKK